MVSLAQVKEQLRCPVHRVLTAVRALVEGGIRLAAVGLLESERDKVVVLKALSWDIADEDVEINVVGDVPWAKVSYDNDISRAVMSMYDTFGIEYTPPVEGISTILGGYWPAYLFAGEPINIPIIGGAAGSGGNAHAANEFWVIEGAEKTYGMAGAEKSVATFLYNYAGKNGLSRPVSTN